jgi:hypothetical protein
MTQHRLIIAALAWALPTVAVASDSILMHRYPDCGCCSSGRVRVVKRDALPRPIGLAAASEQPWLGFSLSLTPIRSANAPRPWTWFSPNEQMLVSLTEPFNGLTCRRHARGASGVCTTASQNRASADLKPRAGVVCSCRRRLVL